MISSGSDYEGRGWVGAWVSKSEELKREEIKRERVRGEGETELKRENQQEEKGNRKKKKGKKTLFNWREQ